MEKTVITTKTDGLTPGRQRDRDEVLAALRAFAAERISGECQFVDEDLGLYLFQTDCIDLMDTLIKMFPGGACDMIFADPPYFLSNGGITCQAGRMVRVDKGSWDKSRGPELNHQFNLEWLSRCQKLLKPNATIWVSGTHHVIHSVGYAMQQLGMKILNDITWEKPNPPPNLSCRYFTHSTETVIWAARDARSRHLFNYDVVRRLNRGRQMKTVWTIPPPSSDEKRYGKHPTQKPVELLELIMSASTAEGDLVMDPFSGSSTTGVAAAKMNRHFIGAETEPEFVRLSIDRLRQAAIERKYSLGVFAERTRTWKETKR